MEVLIWFIASLLALVAVVRWIHQHLHGVAYLWTGSPDAALVLYALPLLPGVLLHELSHAIMALLLRVRIGDFTVIPRRDRRGHVALGSVMIERVDPVRSSLIGLAPLLFGSVAVLLIGYEVFGLSDLGEVILSGEGPAIGKAVSRLFQTTDATIWLYLIFAISNAMLPSASDREPWPPVITFIVGVVVLALIADQDTLVEALAQPVSQAITWLTAAFVITLGINIPVMVLIALLERGTEQISGRRIYYRRPDDDR